MNESVHAVQHTAEATSNTMSDVVCCPAHIYCKFAKGVLALCLWQLNLS